MPRTTSLSILSGLYGISRLNPQGEIPSWVWPGEFHSISKTIEELSIICPQENIPAGVRCEMGWRVLKLEGPFEFTEIGILEKILEPLARAGISILAVSTFETDYVLVKTDQLSAARESLVAAGFVFDGPSLP
ncbi:MAG: ACT domain-containing protein [Anaerolineaceae bacterium]